MAWQSYYSFLYTKEKFDCFLAPRFAERAYTVDLKGFPKLQRRRVTVLFVSWAKLANKPDPSKLH